MSSKPYVVVVGTDFSEHASRALRKAYAEARRHLPAELHVVHASLAASPDSLYPLAPFAGLGGISVEALDQQQAELVGYLDTQLGRTTEAGAGELKIVSHVVIDAPMFAVTRLASELEADLIVVGSHGRHGIARWLLGSVAEAVVRQANCPVLIIPPEASEFPVPAIEPPCRACVEARKVSRGAEQWCEEHRQRHGRRHVYHQGDRVAAGASHPLIVR
jgi:universal stress protein A